MSRLQNLPVLSGSCQLIVISYQRNSMQGSRFPLITNNRQPLTGTAKPEVLQVPRIYRAPLRIVPSPLIRDKYPSKTRAFHECDAVCSGWRDGLCPVLPNPRCCSTLPLGRHRGRPSTYTTSQSFNALEFGAIAFPVDLCQSARRGFLEIGGHGFVGFQHDRDGIVEGNGMDTIR